VDTVVVVQIVRSELIKPARLARVRIARENPAGPLVVAGALIGIPRTGISSAVEDQIQLGVVRDPAPGGAATDLPRISGPARHAEILALILRVVRMEVWTDQNVGVRSGVIRTPGDFS